MRDAAEQGAADRTASTLAADNQSSVDLSSDLADRPDD
jgi:hypothetical protein